MPEASLTHRAHLPDGAGPHPALVLVHGWQGNERVMEAFHSSLPAPTALFYPRAPFEAGPGYGWFLKSGREGDETFAVGLAALRGFVAGLPLAYPAVDAARITLMGFSQGAAISAALLLAAPELARGAALLAGLLPDQAAAWATPGRLAGKPVFMAHGTRDDVLPVTAARAARDALAGAGAAVTYHEYPIGHKLSAQGMRDLTAWLRARV
ncbi:MAG: dienelactone hydrolase family protein [Anaerolineales bacterium]|nr:dienelactone hydrolase family protein [Anaerolineales bacterium]